MFKQVEVNINFPEMEKKWLKEWYEKGLVQKYLHKNDSSEKRFSFLDGPITANNPMGVHHAWGRTYKDLWPKFYNLLGYRQRFQNGFDCQGLWVEVEVEKELKLKNKKEIESLVPGDKKASIAKFVELCKQRVYKYSKIQTEQSKRLGYFADWDHSYFTMSDENNYMIWHFLKTAFENGWIYKGHESVPWCPRCETAISEHEILTEDYKELVHESIYLKLKISNRKNEYLLVWTTTPWTIPANIAVAVGGRIDYSLVETEKGNFWVAKDAIKRVIKLSSYKVIKTVKGKDLVGLKYEGPFDDLPAVQKVAKGNSAFHTVVETDPRILPITTTEGTGMVHTAVSAGTEDFQLGKKLNLPMIPVIADNADYLPNLGFLSGKNAKKNPRIVLDYLEEKAYALEIFKYKHRYPACWRCKSELVWKVADEWYIAMDRRPLQTQSSNVKAQNLTLRERMIKAAKKIKWLPEFGLDRELDWLKNMHDWLISKKNRYWGLALPIYECKKCGNFEVIGSKAELKQRAVKGWNEFEGHTPHKPFIDEVMIKCSQCGEPVKRIDDVGNPWLDAGIVPYSTITEHNQGEPLYLKNSTKGRSSSGGKDEWKKWFPVDFITESFPGQFKNWFYALIAESTVLENTNPFKTVLGFGTMLDENGRPFHKSAGNAIEFVEGADRFGADIIRWACISHNPAENILFGEHKVRDVMRRFYLTLWNIYKFYVEYANLDKFKFDRHSGEQSQVPDGTWQSDSRIIVNNDSGQATVLKRTGMTNVLDRWILSRFNSLVQFVEKSLKEYNPKDAAFQVEKFVSDLSTWYIRRSRDRVWVNSEDQTDKQHFYQTLHYVLVNLSTVLSPFMPFITEEIFTNLQAGVSVHLSKWPLFNSSLVDNVLEKQMELARQVVEAGHAKRKLDGKKVRIPLARLEITVSGDFTSISDQVWGIILKELNVKNILVNKKSRYPKKEVNVSEEELEREGKLRELLRSIQSQRKTLGLQPTDKVDITIPKEFIKEKELIKNKVVAKSVSIGEKLEVKK